MPMSAVRPARGRKVEKSGVLHETWEIVKTIAIALLVALLLRVFLFQPFTIPSASMEPALYQGDYIIVTKWNYGYSRHSIPFSPPVFDGRIMGSTPKRGDIAVFKLPRDDNTDYIKRVIGLPGDRIHVTGNKVFVNGVASTYASAGEPTVAPDCDASGAPRPGVELQVETLPDGFSHLIQECSPTDPSEFAPQLQDETGRPIRYIVPEGHLFMMGDNRDNSIDSRWPEADGVSFVPLENVVGKAELILVSWSREVELFKPWTWFTELRPSRFFKRLR